MPNKNQEAATIWPTIWQILLLKIDLARNQAKASSEFQMGPVDESPLPIVKIAGAPAHVCFLYKRRRLSASILAFCCCVLCLLCLLCLPDPVPSSAHAGGCIGRPTPCAPFATETVQRLLM
jgi:hypothetical protein